MRQPEMWTLGSGVSVGSTIALAALFCGFFVLSLVRHFGIPALAFSGLCALLMIVLAAVQWRTAKRRDRAR